MQPRSLLFVIAIATVLLLHGSARASPPPVPLATVNPDDAIPTRDSVIPTNARLVAFADPLRAEMQRVDVVFTRTHADGTSEPLDSSVAVTGAAEGRDVAPAFIVDLGALSSSEGVSVSAECPSCDDLFTFTVADIADTTAPAFEANSRPRLSLTRTFDGSNHLVVDGCWPAVTDDSQTLLRLDVQLGADADSESTTFPAFLPFDSTPSCPTHASFTVPDTTAVCVDTAVVDVAGNESPPIRACATDIPDDAAVVGCSSSSATPLAAPALWALALGGWTRWKRRAALES